MTALLGGRGASRDYTGKMPNALIHHAHGLRNWLPRRRPAGWGPASGVTPARRAAAEPGHEGTFGGWVAGTSCFCTSARVMRCVEIVRGPATSDETIE